MIRIRRLPGRYGEASFLGLAFALVAFIVLSKAMLESPWPLAFKHYDQHLAGWISLRVNAVIPEFFPDIARRYSVYLSALPDGYRPWHLLWRFDGPFILATLFWLWITWIVGRGQFDTRILSGRRLYEGRAAQRELRERAREECAISGTGLKLHPSFDWSLSRDRTTRSVIAVGSIGGGKTVAAIKPLLNSAIACGDKVLVFDNKGEFTAEMSVPFVLVTPWDKRSHAWDIARDCCTQQDARELAARLVPDSQDPMWSNAARQILSAVVQKLQNDKPMCWTWPDLYKAICLPQESLSEIVGIYAPEGRATATEGKTIDGILINFSAYMTIVADLASAWGNTPPEKWFSFSAWLHDPNPKEKVVIFQGSGRYSALTKAYVQSIISMISGRINSAAFPETKTKRIGLFLDEFPQLGKLENFEAVVETGRSRGIYAVLGFQDYSQLEMYGPAAKVFESSIGTIVLVRVNPGETAQYIAKELIGYATIEKTILHDGKPQPAATQQQLVLEPSDISDYLGPTKHGIRAVLLGFGDAFILEWPYTDTPKLREASIEAAWVTAGVQSNQPLPSPTGVPPMAPTTAQPSQESQHHGLPRLKLRAPTPTELNEMAETGSDIRFAPEPLADMQVGADVQSGGDK